MNNAATITQSDVKAVREMTGLPAFTSEEKARRAARTYLMHVKVKLVTLSTKSGKVVTAWTIQ